MAGGHGFHENFGREVHPEPGSIGGFAGVMAAACWVLAWILRDSIWTWLALAAGLVFLILWRWAPAWLAPLNRAWFHLGMLLGRIMTPLVMGVVYFGVVTPIGLIRRLMGRDSLRLKRSAGDSYWIERNPPGPDPEQLPRQF